MAEVTEVLKGEKSEYNEYANL